jgi:hypothetical protein
VIVGTRIDVDGPEVDNDQTSSIGFTTLAGRAGRHIYRFLFANRSPRPPDGSVFDVDAGEWITPSVCVAPLVAQEEVVNVASSSHSDSEQGVSGDLSSAAVLDHLDDTEGPALASAKARALLKEFEWTSYPSCKFPTCDRVVWSDRSGRRYDFCGKTHASAFGALKTVAEANLDAPVMV